MDNDSGDSLTRQHADEEVKNVDPNKRVLLDRNHYYQQLMSKQQLTNAEKEVILSKNKPGSIEWQRDLDMLTKRQIEADQIDYMSGDDTEDKGLKARFTDPTVSFSQVKQ